MNDALRARYVAVLDYWLGPPGRSVDRQVAETPIAGFTHAVVFDASVCIEGAKLWSGDLDLTENEANLAAASEDTSKEIYVLPAAEDCGRYDEPFLESHAVYWVNPGGGTGYSRRFVGGPDGRLAVRATDA